MYTCGITPVRLGAPGPCRDLPRPTTSCSAGCATPGTRPDCVRNVTDVDDDILRKARELGVHYLDLAAQEIATFRPRHGGARDPARRRGAARDLGDPRHPLAHRQRARRGRRLRGGRVDLLPRRRRPAPSARSATSAARRCCVLAQEHGGQPRGPEQARPARLRAVAAVASPTSLPGSRAGARDGPVGTSSARRSPCASSATTVDIHGGGRDLVFPHHECEAAQSESVTRPAVRAALGARRPRRPRRHEDVEVARQPRLRLRPARSCAPAAAVRLALLAHHYRHDWDWTDADLDDAPQPATPRGARRSGAPTAPRSSRRCAPRSTTTSTRPAALARSTRRPRGIDVSARRSRSSALACDARDEEGDDARHGTIRLPDGATKEMPSGARPTPISPRRSAPGWRRRSWPPSRRAARRPGGALRDGARSGSSPPTTPEAATCCATRPRTCSPRPCCACGRAPTTQSDR